MKKILKSKHRPVAPSPAALITSVDKDGKPNIITLGEVFNISISKPVIMGIAIRSATYSYSLIQSTGEFVINLTTSALCEKVDLCGSISGRNGFDKFTQFGLTPVPATFVKPPLIDECPINIECRVMSIQKIGDHDLILGEVAAVHTDADKIDELGNLIWENPDLLVYITGSYWSMGKKLASQGFTKGNKE